MGSIVNLLVDEAAQYPSITLTQRQLYDYELLAIGGSLPARSFMKKDDYESVVTTMRLTSGELCPMPITLSVQKKVIDRLKLADGTSLTLRDEYYMPLAILDEIEIYKPDLEKECLFVYGTIDTNHPYVYEVLSDREVYYVGGKLRIIQCPIHQDFLPYRLSPAQLKEIFREKGWKTVIGFQTRNPMHLSHIELTKVALADSGDPEAKLLIHPACGPTQKGDIDYTVRVRCYQHILSYYPEDGVYLSLLPLAMRMAGPREVLWHAQIRKNYGCTHFIVGRDAAAPSSKDKQGRPFYEEYGAHELLQKYEGELGIKILFAKRIVYIASLNKYLQIDQVPNEFKGDIQDISGTELRRRLSTGEEIPTWYSPDVVVAELRIHYRVNSKRGFCLYIIGLPSCGKSTLAGALSVKLSEIDRNRRISILDGDVVRTHLSKGLGFSREDRSVNVRRIGYVASEIVKHGGICIVANVAPYEEDRQYNRQLIEQYGYYVEIFVDTPLSICEIRDSKGLYQLAKQGKLNNMTGINDPFEVPKTAELRIAGIESTVTNVEKVISYLRHLNLE